MPESKNGILIHIFSGCHMGAEILVPQGKYLFGNDDSCDYILMDKNIAPHHFSLEILANPLTLSSEDKQDYSVKITPLEGRLSINGTEITEENEWEAESLLSVQGTQILWAKDNMEEAVQNCRKNLYRPDTPKNSEQENTAKSPAAEPETLPISDNNIGISENSAEETPKKLLHKKNYLGIALSVITLIALIVTFTPIGQNELKDTQAIENILKENGFSDIKVILTDKGIMWQGILDNDRERAKLHSLAQKMQFPVYLDITIREDIVKTLKNIYALKKISPTITINGKEIFVGYYVKDELYKEIAQKNLAAMLPYYREIEDRLTVNTVYEKELAELLRQKQAKTAVKKLNPIFEEGRIYFSGSHSREEEKQIRTVMDEISGELGFQIPYHFAVAAIAEKKEKTAVSAKKQSTAEKQQNSGFKVVSVNTGAIPFITLSSNEKVFIGGVLPDGGILESVTLKELTINHNGSVTIYPLRGNQ